MDVWTAADQITWFGGLIEGVSTLFISQNSTGSEVAEAIRSAAVLKDEISMRRSCTIVNVAGHATALQGVVRRGPNLGRDLPPFEFHWWCGKDRSKRA